MASEPSEVDVIIIGGGPAGLSTALGLCRARHTAVVFDSGVYRNGLSQHVHTVPTWDHKDPSAYRLAAREELTGRYDTVQVIDRAVRCVTKDADGNFIAVDGNDKRWVGRKLVLATGVQDLYPDIEGYADCWVTGIFHCLFCHGYEETGALSAGVLAVDDLAVALPLTNTLARNALQFATSVTVYTHGSEQVASAIQSLVHKKGIKVDTRKITRLIKEPVGASVGIELEDGERITHGFLVHKPRNKVNLGYADSLGLEVSSSGTELKVTLPFNETTVKGCFAVGDLGSPAKVMVAGVSYGCFAAAGIVMQLQAD